MTDAQFYPKTAKYALGPFKAELWRLDPGIKSEIRQAWERQFRQLFADLGLQGTRHLAETWIPRGTVQSVIEDYLGPGAAAEDARDLAD